MGRLLKTKSYLKQTYTVGLRRIKDLYILTVVSYLREINVLAVCDRCLLDFNYVEERLSVRVGQIEI